MLSLLVSCAKVATVLLISGWLSMGLLRAPARDYLRQKALWIMPALYVSAMLSPNIWFVFGACLVMLPIFARSRRDIITLLPFALLGIPLITYDLRIGSSAITTIDSWKLVLVSALIIITSKNADVHEKSSKPVWPIIILFCLALVVSVHGANFTTTARGVIEAGMTYVLPFIVLSLGLRREDDVVHFIVAVVIAISLQAIIGVYQSLSYWPIYENIFYQVDIPLPKLAFKMRAGMMRSTGSYLESTSFSILIAAGFTMALVLKNSFRSPAAYRIMLLILVCGICSTVSRGGFVFLVCAWLGSEMYRARWSSVGLVVVASSLAYGLASFASTSIPVLGAFAGKEADTQGTFDYRQRLLERSLEEIGKHPWFGQDWASINVNMADLRQGEQIIDFVNGYMMVGVSGGVFAIMALLFLFVGSAASLLFVRGRLQTETSQRIAAMCFGLHIAYAVSCFTSGFFGSGTVIYVFILAVSGAVSSLAKTPTRTTIRETPASRLVATP